MTHVTLTLALSTEKMQRRSELVIVHRVYRCHNDVI